MEKEKEFTPVMPVRPGEDWKVTFSANGKEKVLHVPYDQLLQLSELLNDFLHSKGIKSYITDK